ncbi:hypothetical protein [Paraburkholderia aspalathi]|uniref:hypothetical protein n=1 Tax=Paraburkholderia aspalathi TaxID=1324617 RepID=UPI00142DC2F5|nr:hypothetical protein [Paraburkholderia aspalathi]MBK3834794.1 hypothetical protein [Paraburkholderia aspalathi]
MTARTEKGTGLQNRARETAGASGASMLRDFAFLSIFPDCSESADGAYSVRPLNSPN